MNAQPDRHLEQEVDRALKALPELEAPRVLTHRVMAAIAARAATPWYRKPWHAWPLAWQAVSLLVLLGAFGGCCAAAWQLTQAAGYTESMAELRQMFSGVAVVWRALNVVAGAVALAVKQLGPKVLLAVCVAVGMGYAICLGLGTACVRLAWSRD